jgi:hypothetical protein
VPGLVKILNISPMISWPTMMLMVTILLTNMMVLNLNTSILC